MEESYNRALEETKAPMLLIPQSARVLAKNRSCFINSQSHKVQMRTKHEVTGKQPKEA
jgi:hypothetical protein